MVDSLAQDWGLIDESNLPELRNAVSMVRGGSLRKEYARLNSTLDTMLEIKTFSTKKQVRVPGLSRLIEQYFQTVAQGKRLRQRSFWNRIRKMRDWEGSEDEFKSRCEAIYNLAHNTSFAVHTSVDKPEEAIPRGSLRRCRSLNGLGDQAEPDLAQQHNQHGDTPISSTPPNAETVAQSSSQNSMIINRLPKETIQLIVELSTTKVVELLLCGRLGGIPQNVTQYYGCIVGAGRRAAPTVNFGGRNNRGSAVNTSPSSTEVEGNGADDIDDISDDESQYDSAIDASSVRPSISTISLEVQDSDSITTSMRSLRVTYPGHHR